MKFQLLLGSVAAAIQSACYGGAVASGSLFSLAQGAAMGGVAVGSTGTVLSGAAAFVAGVGILKKGDKKKSRESTADSHLNGRPTDEPRTKEQSMLDDNQGKSESLNA